MSDEKRRIEEFQFEGRAQREPEDRLEDMKYAQIEEAKSADDRTPKVNNVHNVNKVDPTQFVYEEPKFTTPDKPGRDISDEVFREYDFAGRVYVIQHPVMLYIGKTAHRVVDENGTVHIVPTVGIKGCVIRYRVKPGRTQVSF